MCLIITPSPITLTQSYAMRRSEEKIFSSDSAGFPKPDFSMVTAPAFRGSFITCSFNGSAIAAC